MITTVYSTGTPQHVHCVECDLWINIVGRALLDLSGRGESPRYAEQIQRHAHAWIFDELHDEDFRLVCQYAGLDPEWVRRIAKTAPERFAAMLDNGGGDDAR